MASVEDIVGNVNAAGSIHRENVQPGAAVLTHSFKNVAHAQSEGPLRADVENAVRALFGGLRATLENAPVDPVINDVNEAHTLYAQTVEGSEQQAAQDCLAASADTIEQAETVAGHQKSLIEAIGNVESAVLAALHEGLGAIAAEASVAYVAAEDIDAASKTTAHQGHRYVVALTHRQV